MRLGSYPCVIKEGTLAEKFMVQEKLLKDIDIVLSIIMIIKKDLKMQV